MVLASSLLYLAMVYVRPGEIVPAWGNIPFAQIAAILAFVVLAISWVMRPRMFLNQPVDAYVLGFVIAAILSNPSWGYLGGALVAVMALQPSLGCYILLRGAIKTPRHLRLTGYVLVALTLFQAVNGIVQYTRGTSLGNVTAYNERAFDPDDPEQQTTGETHEEDGEEGGVLRIRGTGIFNDPNDLAMLFVIVTPLLVGPILRKRTMFLGRVLSSSIAAPIVTALYYTSSRGGFLGFLSTLGPYAWRSGRFARVLVMLGLTGVLVLAPARMVMVSSGESSAQGRVQSWSAGLQMLKSRPILGVGYGQYTDYNDLVAHNSFIHSLAELGLVGGFCFAGMYYWLFRGFSVGKAAAGDRPAESVHLTEWGDDLRNSCLGLFVTMAFLSRQYSQVFFIWLALGACYRQVLQQQGVPVKTANFRDIVNIAVLASVATIALYLFVRMFAVFSSA